MFYVISGVTSLPIMTSSVPVSTAELIESSVVPVVPKEIVKQEITIKEITPVSEIPIITDVKIKEILPSPTMDVAEYSSSKSPLIPREATSEKPIIAVVEPTKQEPDVASPSVIEIHPSPETVSPEVIKVTEENKAVDDAPPSKISLSTQDSINSEIYPSNVPVVGTVSSSVPTDVQPVARTTKAPMIEEEDPLLFDHNPAFPPLPDDLSVLSNHGDELVPEPSADTEHVPEMIPEIAPVPEVIVASISPATDAVVNEQLTTTLRYLPATSVTTEGRLETSSDSATLKVETTSSQSSVSKEFSVISLRSAIPTQISSSSPRAATATSEGIGESSTRSPLVAITENTEDPTTQRIQEQTSESTTQVTTEKVILTSTHYPPGKDYTTLENKEILSTETSSNTPQEQTTSSIAKSNVPTEVTSQTELSSLPIETSDQNPHDAAENVSRDALDILTVDPLPTVDKISPSSAEVITVAKSADTGTMENVETTEFILNSFGSSETATDAVELIKIAGDSTESENHAAIIDNTGRNKNALSDLFKLVSDVASISDHTDATAPAPVPAPAHPAASPSISESEELIPVNAGYKSKTNYNQNSITEVPVKSKSVTPLVKQKVVEIEDDDSGSITDSPPPNDKVEPTTRRPIIDNVSDDKLEKKKTDRKDIEIITQSYVPTISRRPTKVVLQQEKPQEDTPAASVETATESSEAATAASQELISSAEDHGTESALSLEQ